MYLRVATVVLFLLGAADAFGAEIRVQRERSDDFELQRIIIEGPIQRGDYDKFMSTVRGMAGYVENVYLYTPGGDFFEAMRIGRALRRLRLPARAPMSRECEGSGLTFLLENGYLKNADNCVCASAGFFILVGAVSRSGEEIYFHRPVLPREALVGLAGSEAAQIANKLKSESDRYLEEMGVPKALVDLVWSVPGNDVVRLAEALRRQHFFLLIPEFQDWYDARCPGDKSTLGCFNTAMEDLQAEGYREVFNEDPNVYERLLAHHQFLAAEHPYPLWIQARSFLGTTREHVNRVTRDRYFGVVRFGATVRPLFSELDYYDSVILRQNQRGPDPFMGLVVREGTVVSVIVSYDGRNSVFAEDVLAAIDAQIQRAFGPGKEGRTAIGERHLVWRLDRNTTAKLTEGEARRSLVYTTD